MEQFLFDAPGPKATKGEKALHLIHGKDIVHEEIWASISKWAKEAKGFPPKKNLDLIPVEPFEQAVLVGSHAHKFAKDFGVGRPHRDAILDEVRCIRTQFSRGQDAGQLAGKKVRKMPSKEAAEALVIGPRCSINNLARTIHKAGYSLAPEGEMLGGCEMKGEGAYDSYTMAFCNGLMRPVLFKDRATAWPSKGVEMEFGEVAGEPHMSTVRFEDIGGGERLARVYLVDDISPKRREALLGKLKSLGWSEPVKEAAGYVLTKKLKDAQREAKALGTLITASKDLNVVVDEKCGKEALDVSYERALEAAKDWKKPLPGDAPKKMMAGAVACAEKKCKLDWAHVYSPDLKEMYKELGCK